MTQPAPDDSQLIDALTLQLLSLRPRTQQLLLDHFGSPSAVLAAGPEAISRVEGLRAKQLTSLIGKHSAPNPREELDRCRAMGIDVLLKGNPEYPRLLSEIPDPPNLVYKRGTLEQRDELAIAIVGARRCTLYGRQHAERLAGALARAGITIVSGLARGIDAAAHRGAIDAGGRTIAVLATGLANVYPPEHAELAEEVTRHGALISESPLDQKSRAELFPQRNRIISGLALGVLIVEASRTSGALHTARHAMEQGRDVFAVPGRIDSLASEGCHNLIRDGVPLVRSADDILESLGPLVRPVAHSAAEQILTPRELTLTDQERQILNHLSTEPSHVDDLLRVAGIESSRVLATLTVLEMKRMIRRLPGGQLVRITH